MTSHHIITQFRQVTSPFDVEKLPPPGGINTWSGGAVTNDSGRSDWSLSCLEHGEAVKDLTTINMVRL